MLRIGLVVVLILVVMPVFGQRVSFVDPAGDDDGPGSYVYPTDAVYKRGSFDLTGFTIERGEKKTAVEVTVGANLEDPWSMGTGFAIQMVFVFIDSDGLKGSGHTAVPPGLNFAFAPAAAWEKVLILSPQQPDRVRTEVAKIGDLKSAVIVPDRTKGAGRTISATIDNSLLPAGDPSTWGFQVVMQSNDGFPSIGDLLTRKVNEYEGQHRFGGGHDEDCDPHVLDLLAGAGAGAKEEIAMQHTMLAYTCNDDGTGKLAEVSMVRVRK